MAQTYAAPTWTWNDSVGQYFYHDSLTNQDVYQDGRRTQQPLPNHAESHKPTWTRGNDTPGRPRSDRTYRLPIIPRMPVTESTGTTQQPRTILNPQVQPCRFQPPFHFDSGTANTYPVRTDTGGSAINRDIDIDTVNACNPLANINRAHTGPPDDPLRARTEPKTPSGVVTCYRMGLGSSFDGTERLYETFKVRMRPHNFFTKGMVFLVLWSEPAGDAYGLENASYPGTSLGRYGERVFSKVRRFVVIREGYGYCSALPIVTYGAAGVGKRNVMKSEHAIIYTGTEPPEVLPDELPSRGEEGMLRPIRVCANDRGVKLDPLSRIDFGKVHTVHHNVKVKNYGQVHPHSMAMLQYQFAAVWAKQLSCGVASSWKDGTQLDEDESSLTITSTGSRPLRKSSGTVNKLTGNVMYPAESRTSQDFVMGGDRGTSSNPADVSSSFQKQHPQQAMYNANQQLMNKGGMSRIDTSRSVGKATTIHSRNERHYLEGENDKCNDEGNSNVGESGDDGEEQSQCEIIENVEDLMLTQC